MKKLQTLALSLILSATTAFAHSEAFKPEFVDTLVAPYLEMQNSLADDNLKAAQIAAKHYLEAMKKAPHEGEAHEETAELTAPAKAITVASDLKSARNAFLSLSKEMTLLVKHNGTNKDTPLYIAHCPMAFDNKGGSWLQANKTVSNPYYGSMMLRCGSIKKQIAGKQPDTASKKENHGHSH